jgi:hypothetical protein
MQHSCTRLPAVVCIQALDAVSMDSTVLGVVWYNAKGQESKAQATR